MTSQSHRDDLDVVETTLRDGNYVVDFQFTAEDTAWLCRELEDAGVRLIEIGHGLGLGASGVHDPAAASDEAYLTAARSVLTKARFGMFCIPGVARLDDLVMAADHGMDFIRIGANVDQTRESLPFIEKARSLGLEVCTNFMKSYCLEPAAFVEMAKMTESAGSQMNYLVDSAGGMLPGDIRRYCEALAEQTDIPFGFHGHDNIRLANANSLMAIECGARWVDATLFGVGRGSGNAATELIIPLLQRKYDVLQEVDTIRLIHLAETQAIPLTFNRHQEALSTSLGLAGVHSMYLKRILAKSKADGIDPHLLIAAVGEIDRLDATEEILDKAVKAARQVDRERQVSKGGFFSPSQSGDPLETVLSAENIAKKLALPCQIWLADSSAAASAEVVQTAEAIELRVRGKAEAILHAVSRPDTELMLCPGVTINQSNNPFGDATKITKLKVNPEWATR